MSGGLGSRTTAPKWDLILAALELGLQAWRTTASRDRFFDAIAELGHAREGEARCVRAEEALQQEQEIAAELRYEVAELKQRLADAAHQCVRAEEALRQIIALRAPRHTDATAYTDAREIAEDALAAVPEEPYGPNAGMSNPETLRDDFGEPDGVDKPA